MATGTLTMLFASILGGSLTAGFGLPVHLFFVLFIPAGALAGGAFAASGYYAGALLTGRRPGRLALTAVAGSSVAAYAGIFALSYFLDGSRLPFSGTALDFVHYLTAHLRTAPVLIPSLNIRLHELFALPLGLVGWAGFVAGSALVANHLASRPHCDECRRYLPQAVSSSAFGTFEALLRTSEEIRQLVRAGRSTEALTLVRTSPHTPTRWKLTLEHTECSACAREHARLQVWTFVSPRAGWLGVFTPRPWKPVPRTGVTTQVNRPRHRP